MISKLFPAKIFIIQNTHTHEKINGKMTDKIKPAAAIVCCRVEEVMQVLLQYLWHLWEETDSQRQGQTKDCQTY